MVELYKNTVDYMDNTIKIRPRWVTISPYRTIPLPILPVLPPMKRIIYKPKKQVLPQAKADVNLA